MEQGSDVEHQGAGGTGFRRNKVPMLNIKVPGNNVPRIKVTDEQGSGTSNNLCRECSEKKEKFSPFFIFISSIFLNLP